MLGLGFNAKAQSLATSTAPAEIKEKFYFHSETEFPNYFLPAQYRRSNQTPPEEVLQKTQELLEKAVGSIHNRMVVNLFIPGKSAPEKVHLFSYLQNEVEKIDSQAKIYTSGGFLRSVLGYLYKEMYKQAQLNPDILFDPSKFLLSVAQDKSEIMAEQIRGVGSDLDMLIDQTTKKQEIKNKLLEIINEGFNRFSDKGKVDNSKLSLYRAIFLQGDVKDYQSQTNRSSSEGGCSLDWLAFDFNTAKYREPSRNPRVVKNFISGQISYMSPTATIPISEHAGTVVRGLRPLLEIPFLKYQKEDFFRKELHELLEYLNSNSISDYDLMQISKMSRNSNFGAAHNRFYRARAATLDNDIATLLKKIRLKTKLQKYLPIFVENEDVRYRKAKRMLPSELYISPTDLISKYTDSGKLYHGTPEVENALSMVRNGLQVSGHGHGEYLKGRGSYLTTELKTAQGYAGNTGTVMTFNLQDPQYINAIDWSSAKDHPFIQKVIEWCQHTNIDVFEYLAQEYKIDVIFNEHALLQNQGALKETALSFDQLNKILFKSKKVETLNLLRSLKDHNKDQLDRRQSKNVLERFGSIYDAFRMSDLLGKRLVDDQDVKEIQAALREVRESKNYPELTFLEELVGKMENVQPESLKKSGEELLSEFVERKMKKLFLRGFADGPEALINAVSEIKELRELIPNAALSFPKFMKPIIEKYIQKPEYILPLIPLFSDSKPRGGTAGPILDAQFLEDLLKMALRTSDHKLIKAYAYSFEKSEPLERLIYPLIQDDPAYKFILRFDRNKALLSEPEVFYLNLKYNVLKPGLALAAIGTVKYDPAAMNPLMLSPQYLKAWIEPLWDQKQLSDLDEAISKFLNSSGSARLTQQQKSFLQKYLSEKTKEQKLGLIGKASEIKTGTKYQDTNAARMRCEAVFL